MKKSGKSFPGGGDGGDGGWSRGGKQEEEEEKVKEEHFKLNYRYLGRQGEVRADIRISEI